MKTLLSKITWREWIIKGRITHDRRMSHNKNRGISSQNKISNKNNIIFYVRNNLKVTNHNNNNDMTSL